jgi:hypothetical protein
MSTIQGFAHLVHKGGRCLREEEKYRSSFGPFVRLRYSWWLIFSSMRRYLLERVDSARCDLSAWFLHFSRRSGVIGTSIGQEHIEGKRSLRGCDCGAGVVIAAGYLLQDGRLR